ncbi:MAG: D-amino-acid transaminase [Alphaproteobacteria bacterium]|nr:D-amino-acid transaminase [Alphaproteobacteria bacterium]
MSRIAYVAGHYLPHAQAAVHIEDRGFQFADGVYEVIAVVGGRLVDEERHMVRLHRSLSELRMAPPMGDTALRVVLREVIRRNGVVNGIVYLQVTRGAAPRDHAFPKSARPTLVVTSRGSKPPNQRLVREGCSVITIPEIRWARCDIKSVALLGNVLGKQLAREAGAYEAWFVDHDGNVTEGTSTNAWIVTADGEVVTRKTDNAILSGVTRLAVLDLIHREGYRLSERPFSVDEAKRAREAFLTSTTAAVMPVVRIDDAAVANGNPGSLTEKLRVAYLGHAAATA